MPYMKKSKMSHGSAESAAKGPNPKGGYARGMGSDAAGPNPKPFVAGQSKGKATNASGGTGARTR